MREQDLRSRALCSFDLPIIETTDLNTDPSGSME
jgi:hypothetical protein